MAEIVNLRRVRKARERADAAKTADDNRIRFGRSRPERAACDIETAREQRRHDGHDLTPSDGFATDAPDA